MKKIGVAFVIFLSFLSFLFLGKAYASNASDFTFKLNSISARKNQTDWYDLNITYTNKGKTGVVYWIDITGTSSKGSIEAWKSETLESSGTVTWTLYDTNLSTSISSLKFSVKEHMNTSDPVANVIVDLSSINGGYSPTTTTTSTPTTTRTTTRTTSTLTITNNNTYGNGVYATLIDVTNEKIKIKIDNRTTNSISLGWVSGSKVFLDTNTTSYEGTTSFVSEIKPNTTKEITVNLKNDITNINQIKGLKIDYINILGSNGLPSREISIDADVSKAEYSRTFFQWIRDNYVFVLIILIPVLLLILYLIFRRKKKNSNYNNNSGNNNFYNNSSNKSSSYRSSSNNIFNNNNDDDLSSNSYNYQPQNTNSSQQDYTSHSVREHSVRYANADVKRRRTATGSFIGAIVFFGLALVVYFVFMKNPSFSDLSDNIGFVIIPRIMFYTGIIVGTVNLIFAIKKKAVKLNGKRSVGVVKRAWQETHSQYNNGAYSQTVVYYVEFSYEDQYGELADMVQTISHKIYKSMAIGMQIPILVYKKDALFDVKAYKNTGSVNAPVQSEASYTVKKKIFISYRRDGGLEAAELLYEKLHNYHNVFMDKDLGYGDFEAQLNRNIDNCDVILLILSKGCLEKREGKDYYFMEIARAYDKNKIIIPVILRSFDTNDNNIYWNELKTLQCVDMSSNQPGVGDDAARRINDMLNR